jgi:large subunit GTPase 1
MGERKEGEGKRFILCINKADYLSEDLIKHWNNYFREKNVNHVFISAKKEQEKLDAQETDSEEEDYDEEAEPSEEEK